MLISYDWLIANYHQGITKNSKIVILMPGMPILPKNTSFADASIFLWWGFDLIMPEYYGSFRSDWEFTLENCFKTIERTIAVCKWWSAQNLDQKLSLALQYQTIYLYGSSFSAYFVIRYSDYSGIQWIWLSYPMLTWPSDNGFPEETTYDIDYDLNVKWSKYFYRMSKESSCTEFFESLSVDHQDAIQNIWQIPVFIGHGDMDTCLHISRSQEFYKDLQAQGGNVLNRFVKIPGKNHGSSAKTEITTEFIKWTIDIQQLLK